MADLGTGTTAVFGTSSFALEFTQVDWNGRSRESIQTSHMGTTTNHTFVPSNLSDSGEIVVTGYWDGDEAPPIDGAAETLTVAWGGSVNTDAVSVFCTGVDISAPLEGLMECTATFKASGAIT